MCGRYAAGARVEDLAETFGIRLDSAAGGHDLPPAVDLPPPSYNVAPTDPVPAVIARPAGDGEQPAGTRRELRGMRWGLLPWWTRNPREAARRINARVETVAARPAFRAALAQRRCLLPADGYFEWASGPGGKQPYFLHPADGGLLAFAGLYELWSEPGGTTRWTCTILTTAAAGPLATLHDRMPMLVPAEHWTAWLDPAATDPSAALALPVCPGDRLAAHPVDRRIGDVRAVGADLVAPLATEPVRR